MIIQHNLSAMIAGDANLRNVAGLKKKTEKLSTGYKINRAADNASGLSVSEKMRSQIRGLSQATSNANDAISLMQTAEGGLQETEDILQRMRELAVQSANGTYTDEDRAHLQDEVDALKGEIDRISESTEFNEMKLLSGEVSLSLETKVPTNDYGARYGSINYDLDIGGGKVSVASSIQGMWLKFTTGASGKGGENAFYEYDVDRTQGELTQHITINLAEGQTYTDEQIQKLIDNAKYPKEFETAPGKVLFKSEIGQIHAAEAETYGLLTGDEKQQLSADLNPLGKAAPITPGRVSYTASSTKTYNHSFSLKFNTSAGADIVSVDKTGGKITVAAQAEYDTMDEALTALAGIKSSIMSELTDGTNYYANTSTGEPGGQAFLKPDGSFMKTNNAADISWRTINTGSSAVTAIPQYQTDEEGNDIISGYKYALKEQNIGITVKTSQCVAYVPSGSAYSFDITATQYGSYGDYVADEEKYKYPDAVGEFNMNALKGVEFKVVSGADEPISVSFDSSNMMTVTLREDSAMTGNEIKAKMEQALADGGYNYTVSMTETKNKYPATAAGTTNNLDSSVIIRDSGTTEVFAPKSGSDITADIVNPGHRSVKRVGTVAGIRQTAEGDLTALMIRPGSGTVGSSDHIKFTANSYGKAVNYKETLVSEFRISTEQDLPAGGEYVDTSSGIAEIHLATGTKYTNESIEKLLKDAGLDYTVELTDSHNPDGDKDGEIIFNNTGSVRVPERVAGQGVGTDDVADITDKLEFQIGANGVEDQKVGMDIIDASAKSIGVDDIDISTQNGANKAIEKIDKAVKQVSTFRSKMGALQNRMEKSVNSLNISNENLTSAESQIRDTDMAAEMVEYQKNNILQQASQSMLAQANQQPNGVLSLLG